MFVHLLDDIILVLRIKIKQMDAKPIKSHNSKNKIKLIKDLKYGKVHLRQSLLEMTEIEDLSKLFKMKKENYSITDQDVTLATEKTEQN